MIWRLAVATPLARCLLAPVYGTTVVWAGARLVESSALFLDWVPFHRVQLVGLAALALLPFGFGLSLLRARARPVARRPACPPARAQRAPVASGSCAFARRRDGGSRLWAPELNHYLTAGGRPVELPKKGSQCAATFVEDEGKPVAVLVTSAEGPAPPIAGGGYPYRSSLLACAREGGVMWATAAARRTRAADRTGGGTRPDQCPNAMRPAKRLRIDFRVDVRPRSSDDDLMILCRPERGRFPRSGLSWR